MEDIIVIQRALSALGFEAGVADGVIGARTRRAIAQYQSSLGEEATGTLTDRQAVKLTGRRIHARSAGQAVAGMVETTAVIASLDGEIRASRLFAGPGNYPPAEFAAYGILAFKSEASSYDRNRYVMICEAYISSIRQFDQLPVPVSAQMATVWPVTGDDIAAALMKAPRQEVCMRAVDAYGNVAADRALRDAALAGAELAGLGPYLLAWSPATKKGARDAIVLIADLSDVHDYAAALDVLLNWVRDIERDPSLWSSGWTLEKLRVTAQRWVDRRGPELLRIVGGSSG